MPPEPFLSPDELDFNNVLFDQEAIYSLLPHRYEFKRLDAIVHLDVATGLMAGYHDLREDEFWVRGHIPGRPIFPGVMMIETAAQLVSHYAMSAQKNDGFLGFAAVDNVKFRGTVTHGQRLIMLGKMIELKTRRCIGETQGFVDGKMVFEARITGMWL